MIFKVPTQQKTYAPWDSASGIPPNDPSKLRQLRTYSAALFLSILWRALRSFKQETPQYENRVSTSPQLSPKKEPLGCCRPLTYSITFSVLISLHRVKITWCDQKVKEWEPHSVCLSCGSHGRHYLRILHLHFGTP